jgi:hypothetical protein
MMAGRRAKAAEGRYVGGISRFGYSTTGGELVADELEQAVVARMPELKAQGCSLRAVAQRLNDECLRPKRGERWQAPR